MSSSPRGMSVQEAYRLYCADKLLVNRAYQRKLVWSTDEKQLLIKSILENYPIPLILLAGSESEALEVIDGLQRLHAIFSFIEQDYEFEGKYFDVAHSTRASEAADEGLFERLKEPAEVLSKTECADLLDYQLAVTVFHPRSDEATTEVFRRINSGGRQLSAQEKRQAGVLSDFATVVRRISSTLRTDASEVEVLPIRDVPTVSINSTRERLGYGVKAEQTVWCRQGILAPGELRESEDEQFVADLAAAILLDGPTDVSEKVLNDLYDTESDLGHKVATKLRDYYGGPERFEKDMEGIFSLIVQTIERVNPENKALLHIVTGGVSARRQKTPFFSIFLAFYKLVHKRSMVPSDDGYIVSQLESISTNLIMGKKNMRATDRKKNAEIVEGRIQDGFTYTDPLVLPSGQALAYEVENILRRSMRETSRYEVKQGLVKLDDPLPQAMDVSVLGKLPREICAIANVGPEADGALILGVADSSGCAERIAKLYGVEPVEVGARLVVGVEREVAHLGLSSMDDYVSHITRTITASQLDKALATQIAMSIDCVSIRGRELVIIRVPRQSKLTLFGEEVVIKDGERCRSATPREVVAAAALFA